MYSYGNRVPQSCSGQLLELFGLCGGEESSPDTKREREGRGGKRRRGEKAERKGRKRREEEEGREGKRRKEEGRGGGKKRGEKERGGGERRKEKRRKRYGKGIGGMEEEVEERGE